MWERHKQLQINGLVDVISDVETSIESIRDDCIKDDHDENPIETTEISSTANTLNDINVYRVNAFDGECI